ncbi:hypothetical protein D1B31_02960 [Neobacillus notoginsengisoli]|uniref:Polyhydroxyalkanoate synthesis regulator n=1 Tax=Neobacillus notoginsengisoli TaxID=1578198 RepID=A0A417YYF8_9BACI|nr:hypothetical protein [Neobacillus notoginsengisoli]RHW42570.1 hypothetical protein D1B31_02960 [Neobacillus notoginsengisoli]
MINDLFSKGILLGLGAAVAGKEKLEETIMKMADQGMMSKKEADSLFSDLVKKGAQKSENWNKDIRDSITAQLRELGFVTRSELETLQAQIVLLQQELAGYRADQGSKAKGPSSNQTEFSTGLSSTGTGTSESALTSQSQAADEIILDDADGQQQAGYTGNFTDSGDKKIPPNTDNVLD